MSRQIHPTFFSKKVIRLECKFCRKCICSRGMKALLLADTEVELYSTDLPPPNAIIVVGNHYSTKNCDCRIKDVACIGCGNIVGYHVVLPCQSCLESCNNGHFWMFHSNASDPSSRLDASGMNVMVWGTLPPCYEDLELYEDLAPEIECLR